MKNKYILIALSGILIAGCHSNEPFHEVKTNNPDFYANTVFKSFEDISSPRFAALKEKYQLDTIFHGEQDEFKRMLLLRHWVRSVVPINDPGPHPGDGSAESILDHALKGNGYHCGHYMVVQNAIMNAYGYVTRCLGAGPGRVRHQVHLPLGIRERSWVQAVGGKCESQGDEPLRPA